MKTCESCQNSFQIFDDEKRFLEKMDFKFGDKVYRIPEPELCPDCRAQRRVSHRNERNMYQNKSAMSGKQLICIYAPGTPWGMDYKIYTKEEWNSDEWDPTEYGRDFDFSRPFFEQFEQLQAVVPKINLVAVDNQNSPYVMGVAYSKNCHVLNSSEYCEDCYYGKLLQKVKNAVDCSYVYDSELCYECFSVYNSYNCVHLSYSSNCSNCYFSENLINCNNCFLSTNLKDKAYYFMNEPLEKEAYERRVKEFMGSHANFEKAKEILADLRKKRIHKYANITTCENSTGDFLQNSKGCLDCYDVNDSQDCRYIQVGVQLKDVYDCSNMYIKPELCYQVMGVLETFHVAFSLYTFHSQGILYSDQIYSSKDLFGCVGMKRKQYCILNKQYTKEEYEELVPKIIEHMQKTGEWGQFFPPEMALVGYNDSLASEYFPLSKEEVVQRGWRWHEDTSFSEYKGPEYEIPDHIKDVTDEVCQKILKCEQSGRFYKIIPQELKFYKQMGIPIPHICPDERHKNRMKLRNPRTLYDRQCDKCQASVSSTYAHDRSEKIYCDTCYLKEIY